MKKKKKKEIFKNPVFIFSKHFVRLLGGCAFFSPGR